MTRTVLDFDRDLLERAKTILNQRSYTDTVNEALRRIVRDAAVNDAIDYFANLDDDQQQALRRVRDNLSAYDFTW